MIGWTLFESNESVSQFLHQNQNILAMPKDMIEEPYHNAVLEQIFNQLLSRFSICEEPKAEIKSVRTLVEESIPLFIEAGQYDVVENLKAWEPRIWNQYNSLLSILKINFCIYALITADYLGNKENYVAYIPKKYSEQDFDEYQSQKQIRIRNYHFVHKYNKAEQHYSMQFPILNNSNGLKISSFNQNLSQYIMSKPDIIMQLDSILFSLRRINISNDVKRHYKQRALLQDLFYSLSTDSNWCNLRLCENTIDTLKTNHIVEMMFHNNATRIALKDSMGVTRRDWLWEYEMLINCPITYRLHHIIDYCHLVHLDSLPNDSTITNYWHDLCNTFPELAKHFFAILYYFFDNNLSKLCACICDYLNSIQDEFRADYLLCDGTFTQSKIEFFTHNIVTEFLDQLVLLINTNFSIRDKYDIVQLDADKCYYREK